MHFVVKNHRKDACSQAELFRFISYFFEKAYKFNAEDPIVLVFDMSDAGYANLVGSFALIIRFFEITYEENVISNEGYGYD